MRRTIVLAALGTAAATTPLELDPPVPTARVCILKDFGKPDPALGNRSTEPFWNREAGVITVGSDSAFYSTSPSGGAHGKGVAFRVTTSGQVTILHSFRNALDGGTPRGGLIRGHDSTWWGTTYSGGTLGFGTIFRVDGTDGAPKVLYNFRNGYTTNLVPPCENRRCPFTPRQRADAAGSYPITPPLHDGKGNYYGVAAYSNNQQFGVLYKLSPPYDSTGFKTLCIFDPRMLADTAMAGFVCNKTGRFPASLIMNHDSTKLYGTLYGESGHLYEASFEGKVKIVHGFVRATGEKPFNLMVASNRKIYGTTYSGGPENAGVVYQYDPATNAYLVRSSFRVGTRIAGMNPVAGVVEGRSATSDASDGFLYGITRYGGRFGRGILYRIPLETASSTVGEGLHTLKVLHDLDQASTGRAAFTTPVLHPDGKFYGITSEGGTYGGGVLYRLSEPGFAPRTTSPVKYTAGVVPKDATGKPLTDDMVEVRTGVEFWQDYTQFSIPDGISILVRCRIPHFVQFVFRERFDDKMNRLPGRFEASSGGYAFTTEAANKVWHTDALSSPDAYFEHGKGAAWWSYQSGPITVLKMLDAPGFKSNDLPLERQGPPFNETWRFTAHTYVICNCDVKRKVVWVTEYKNNQRSWGPITIEQADNTAYDFINKQAVADGFRKVP